MVQLLPLTSQFSFLPPSQGIAEGNDAFLIDYSVLYDQIVRATLWVEVGLSVCLPATKSDCLSCV